MPGKVERCAGRNRPDDGQQRPRHSGSKPAKDEDKDQHRNRDQQRRQMHPGKTAADLIQPNDRHARIGLNPKHLAKHCNANLKANPGEESNENSLREKIGDEPKLQQPRHQQKSRCHQSDQARKSNITCAGRGSHAPDSAAKDRRSRRICGDNQVPRRTEGRESKKWQHQGVKPGNDRHSCNPRIPESLRNVLRREDDTRKVHPGRPRLVLQALFPGTDSAKSKLLHSETAAWGAKQRSSFRNANRG